MLVLLTDLLWWWNDLLVWVWVNTYYRSGRSGAKMLVRVHASSFFLKNRERPGRENTFINGARVEVGSGTYYS